MLQYFPQITYFFQTDVMTITQHLLKQAFYTVHEMAIWIVALLCVLEKNLLLVGDVISIWHSYSTSIAIPFFKLHC